MADNIEFRAFLALQWISKNTQICMETRHGERPGNLWGTIFVGNPKAKRNILLKPLKAKKQGVGNARCVPPKEFNEKI